MLSQIRSVTRKRTLVHSVEQSYYQYRVMTPQVPLENEEPLSLYKLDDFDGNIYIYPLDFSIQSSNLQSNAFGKYFALLPFQMESHAFGHVKHYVVGMELMPESRLLKLTGLALNGKYQKYISLDNLVPVPYSDYRESCKRVITSPPTFLDWEMIYFNPLIREFYVFDKEG